MLEEQNREYENTINLLHKMLRQEAISDKVENTQNTKTCDISCMTDIKMRLQKLEESVESKFTLVRLCHVVGLVVLMLSLITVDRMMHYILSFSVHVFEFLHKRLRQEAISDKVENTQNTKTCDISCMNNIKIRMQKLEESVESKFSYDALHFEFFCACVRISQL
jgi:hypothetical protein